MKHRISIGPDNNFSAIITRTVCKNQRSAFDGGRIGISNICIIPLHSASNTNTAASKTACINARAATNDDLASRYINSATVTDITRNIHNSVDRRRGSTRDCDRSANCSSRSNGGRVRNHDIATRYTNRPANLTGLAIRIDHTSSKIHISAANIDLPARSVLIPSNQLACIHDTSTRAGIEGKLTATEVITARSNETIIFDR